MARSIEPRHRAAMLQLVRDTWVAGVLEHSRHDAVRHDLSMVVRRSGQPAEPLPPGTRILDVFDDLGGALLVLGAPGVGKTTMLLTLARDLLDRAAGDDAQPMPVVFSLASWAAEQPPLEAWLITELSTTYYVPHGIAKGWVEGDALLLLLDGLDDGLDASAREACVAAIGAFREAHPVPMAVCGGGDGVSDQGDGTERPHLQGAVVLQPLTLTQVDAYLSRAGAKLHAVHDAVQHDPVLREMARVPLFLNMMALAYAGLGADELETLTTVEARRHHLFETYVRRMLQRCLTERSPVAAKSISRVKGRDTEIAATLSWLVYLAGRMRDHHQTVFLIEKLQFDWLPPRAERRHGAVQAGVWAGVRVPLWRGDRPGGRGDCGAAGYTGGRDRGADVWPCFGADVGAVYGAGGWARCGAGRATATDRAD
jgi:GTPase SAR1 family protein